MATARTSSPSTSTRNSPLSNEHHDIHDPVDLDIETQTLAITMEGATLENNHEDDYGAPTDIDNIDLGGVDEEDVSGKREWIAIRPPGAMDIQRESEEDAIHLPISSVSRTKIALNTSLSSSSASPPPLSSLPPPPSFTASQFHTILRRQRLRPPDNSGIKQPPPSSYPSRFVHLTNSFEFAGWGSISRIKLTAQSEDMREGAEDVARRRRERESEGLGQWTGAALAGNAILGSVFYALPVEVAVAGVYSPISMFIATLVIFLWRPVMEELAAALPIGGAPYTYMLNVSTKSFALLSAALLLLDFSSTSIVSAATAATYLSGELGDITETGGGGGQLPFPTWVGAIIVLVLFTGVSLTGVKESARIALGVLMLHIGTMIVLAVTSIIYWTRVGNSVLIANWSLGTKAPGADTSAGGISKQIFYGVCLGMLGLTGFECIPSYISRIKPGRFPLVLRNLHFPAIVLNTVMMLLLIALVPLQEILSGRNVLSVLGETTGGRWLRIWIVVDAIIVLCGGVLTGILSSSELLTQLAQHRVLPSFFLLALPSRSSRSSSLFRSSISSSSSSTSTASPTPPPSSPGAPYISILAFSLFCALLYASARADLNIISEMFSLVWLSVMALFPIAGVLLRFERGSLVRRIREGYAGAGTDGVRHGQRGHAEENEDRRERSQRTRGKRSGTSLGTVLSCLTVGITAWIGNVVFNPKTLGYFSAYLVGIVLFFSATQRKVRLLRCLYWIYDQYPWLHRDHNISLTMPTFGLMSNTNSKVIINLNTARWGDALITSMRLLRRQPVCILVKGDEINSLFGMILYVRKNEETSNLKIVHFCGEEGKGATVPSELEANSKILDEAFPEITIDLVLVNAEFSPVTVAALSCHLGIPQSLMFVGCPGTKFGWGVEEFGGVRIVAL